MNSWLQRFIVLPCLLVGLTALASAQLVVSDDFESNNVGDFPAGWTQVNGSVGYALVTSSPVAEGSRAVRLSAGLSTASTIRITTAITNDYVYEYYVLIPDTGNVNETIGSVKVENVGMSFALGATPSEGLIFFSSTSDGWAVPTNVYHHVKVEVDYQKSVARVTVNGGAPKKYPVSINTAQDLRLEATALTSTLQKHIVYIDSVSVSLMTVDLTPAYVSLSSPADGATGIGASSVPSFSWSSVTAGTGYHIQIGTDSTFGAGIAYDDTTLTGTSKSVPLPPLEAATSYYWRVRAKNTVGWGDWSTVRRFRTVDPPSAPEMYNPSPGQVFTSTDDVYLSYSSPSGTQTFHVQIALDSLFTNVVVNDSASSSNSWRYVSYPPLTVIQRYYWRVRSFGVAGWGAWSAVRDFSTPQPPAPPVLGAPAQGAQSNDLTQIYFWWNSVSGATAYRLVIAKDSNFTQIVVNDSLTSTAVYQYFPPLEYNTTYYWRMQTHGPAGWGPNSAWRSFRTKPAPTVTLNSPSNGAVQTNAAVALSGSSPFSDGADSFYVQIALDTAFATIVADSVGDSSYLEFETHRFSPSTTYYWRMRARNVAGWGAFSDRRSFVIGGPPPAPTLSSPNNNAVVNAVPVYFTWNSGSAVNIQDYRLQIASDSLFTNIVVDTIVTYSGIYAGEGALVVNTRYYWRVRTRTVITNGPYSVPRSFSTPLRPGPPTVLSPAVGTMDLWGNVTIRWRNTSQKDSSHIQIATDTSSGPTRVRFRTTGALSNHLITGFHYGPHYSNESQITVQVGASEPPNISPIMIHGINFYDPLFADAGQAIFVRVRDCGAGGVSDWSEWRECSVLRTPAPPTGFEPVDGATGVPFIYVPISTSLNPVAHTYHNVTVSRTSDLADPVFVDELVESYSAVNRLISTIPELEANTAYFYQISSVNPVGLAYGPVISFTTADPSPELTCVMDVPDDQGGFIDVDFLASQLDRGPGNISATSTATGLHVNEYSVWRLHEPSTYTPPGRVAEIQGSIAKLPEAIRAAAASFKTTDLWEPVFHFPAIGEAQYRVMIKSRSDSGKKGTALQTVVVIAHSNLGHLFRSAPMSGYSVDNLAPAPPGGGTAVPENGQVRIAWVANDEPDLKEYVIYRALTGTESVSSLTPIGTTTEAGFIDPSPPSAAIVYYYVVARDKNDNDSEPAVIQATIVTGVESLEGVPTEFVLGQNYPNPFNPTTTLRFGVPERSTVTLQVMNSLGQAVDELVATELPAGFFQAVWKANVPSGIYFARMVAAPLSAPERRFSSIKKMILLR